MEVDNIVLVRGGYGADGLGRVVHIPNIGPRATAGHVLVETFGGMRYRGCLPQWWVKKTDCTVQVDVEV